MKHIKKWMIDLFRMIFEYFLLFPLLLIFAVYYLPIDLLSIWLLIIPCLYLIGGLYRKLFKKQRWEISLIVAIILGVASSFLLQTQKMIQGIFIFAHTIFIFRGMMYGAEIRRNLLSIPFLWIAGPVNYFVCFFFYTYSPTLQPYVTLFSIVGIFTISVMLFMVNHEHLRGTTLLEEDDPYIHPSLKRNNRIYLLLTILGVFFLASLKITRALFWGMIRSFFAILRWILGMGQSDEGIVEEEQSPLSDNFLPFEVTEKEPSKIIEMIYTIVSYLAIFLLIIGFIVLILLLIKRTRQAIVTIFQTVITFLKNLRDRFLPRDDGVGIYVDEKENVFDLEKWTKEQQERLGNIIGKVFERKPSWDDLSEEEKIRFVYRSLIESKGQSIYAPHLTPREVIDKMTQKISDVEKDPEFFKELKSEYEKVRYGGKLPKESVLTKLYDYHHRKN